jgi:apolipoprotein N-acyltransferase
MALLTTLSEAYSLTLFDWNFGYTWYGSGIPVFQWAEFIGFSGLSAATILCNLVLYNAWIKRKKVSGKLIFLSVLLIFTVLNAGGVWLKNRLPQPDASFNTLLVQANIGNLEKLAVRLGKGHLEETISRYLNLTDRGITSHPEIKVDFILWPEVAFPALLGEEFMNNRYSLSLSKHIRDLQIPLITGAFSVDRPSRLPTNSLFVLNRNGEIVPPHFNKSILLAFGEYIPGEDIWPQIRQWIPQTGHFARGSGPTTLLQLNNLKIGPQICYEGLFPNFTRSLSELGAQFIVNVTNDSWYGTWQEPYQHMYMTLARAVEFRRPLIRVTNTGISTVVIASGEILERSPMHQEWTGIYTVPYLKNPAPTFYQQWFWLIPTILWMFLLGLLVVGVRNK